MEKMMKGSTPRVTKLLQKMYDRSFTDRTNEWFSKTDLPNVAKRSKDEDRSLFLRRALALKVMLKEMTKKENSENTHCCEIKEGELIVGNIPMGSLGFGKVFPNYLTREEKEVAYFSSRDVESVLGHNAPDYSKLLTMGLKGIMDVCNRELKKIEEKEKNPPNKLETLDKRRRIFYQSVIISCNAVIDYANCFAVLVEEKAEHAPQDKKDELLEVARICRKVPYEPAESFHEALQSIYFLHLTFHASTSHVSFGRLDQVLEPCLNKSLTKGEINLEQAQELIECFFIKCAERLTTTMEFAVDQDFADYATGMGNSPFLVDQEATINQFMQNIVIGGQTKTGNDATNQCTYLILDACSSLGIITPIVNLRLHKNSPQKLVEKAARAALNGNNGLPIIYNDEVIVPALQLNKKLPKEETYDYIVDGCWEVLLNGKCDFTYNMVNMLTVMECALNRGALLSASTMELRGKKESYLSKKPEDIKTYKEFKDEFWKHLNLFVRKAGMQVYSNYCLEGSVTPVPLFSSLLGTCLERGIDKTNGGAEFNIGGVVYIAMPNAANSLASIKKWVFEEKKYELKDVANALRHNFGVDIPNEKKNTDYLRWNQMRIDFLSTPKFGNNQSYVDEEMKWLIDISYDILKDAEEACDEIYLSTPKDENQRRRINRLRRMVGYSGNSMKETYGDKFKILFSAGCGTFAQYALFGSGCAASADGRLRGEPVAPNFSPTSGTAQNGEGAIFSSLKNLGLNKYAAGAIIDVCIPKDEINKDKIQSIYKKFIESNGSILSLTIPGAENIQKAYETCNEVREEIKEQEALKDFADLNVRVGGWNGPFITLTEVQQRDYMNRRITKN